MTLEEIAAISTIILTIITAVYVILTYFLLSHSKKNSERQENLLTMPYITCKIRKVHGAISEKVCGSSLYFSLINYGNQPAFDVEIWIIGISYDDDIDFQIFKSEYIIDSDYAQYAKEIVPTDEDIWGISDVMLFPIIPMRNEMIESLKYPIKIDSVHVVINYRNALKTNYTLTFWLNDDGKSNFGQYESSEPRDFSEATPRIRFHYEGESRHDESFLKNLYKGKEKIPEFLKEFSELYEHSIPAGFIKGNDRVGCEGRGEFKDLK
jgi:hypothetical protein